VLLLSHPVFAGTGLDSGELVGDYGLNTGGDPGNYNGKAAGHETDSSEGPGATAPTICGLPGPTNGLPAADLPLGLQVLARAGTVEQPGSELTFYQHPGGGIVFSVGSINFGGSLAVEPNLQQIVRNAIALPEPTLIGQLLAGTVIVACLARFRVRRRVPRAPVLAT